MIRIGKIVATHGLNGAVVMTHVVGNSTWLKKNQVLMVEMHKGSQIPYFVSNAKAANEKEYIIELEDVNKIEAAKKLVTKQIYVDESILAGFAKQSPLLWIGFSLIDSEKGEIGKIEDVVKSGNQWLGKLTYINAEVLIPLIEQFVNEVDVKGQVIRVTLPEGLLEVYL